MNQQELAAIINAVSTLPDDQFHVLLRSVVMRRMRYATSAPRLAMQRVFNEAVAAQYEDDLDREVAVAMALEKALLYSENVVGKRGSRTSPQRRAKTKKLIAETLRPVRGGLRFNTYQFFETAEEAPDGDKDNE